MTVRRGIMLGLLLPLLAACASRGVVLELTGSVIYEKPRISMISHSVVDERSAGGGVVVEVNIVGDPGLEASFDISPEIAVSEPMSEVADGRYSGRFAFPGDLIGGPFTIVGRLRHEQAGEVTMKDPDPVTISLVR